MPRYFLELSYKGTAYSGFQVQQNALTIQSEVEKALRIFYHEEISLTGSSRTDAGVHAKQNFFHFDTDLKISAEQVYNLNAILPADISITSINQVIEDAHCRFSALSREYCYYIYNKKNPFLDETAWFYPYSTDISLLNKAAELVKGKHDFTSFAKRNTQVNNFICTIDQSEWKYEAGMLVYNVKANRFLRGMVRALVATMLKVGRQTITAADFTSIISAHDCSKADFSAPAHGLFLEKVEMPENIFI
jgi:tRNA pseudouridine38-40 synthase